MPVRSLHRSSGWFVGRVARRVPRRRAALAVAGALTVAVLAPTAGHSDDPTHWSKTWIDGNRFFVLNNAYAAKPNTSMSHFATSKDNWGGSWDYHGETGGIGVAQINYGKWPWGEWTTDSRLPVQVNSATDVQTNWNFTKGSIDGRWNAYYEIWLHSSNDIKPATLTGDLMIHPDWDSTAVGPGNTSYGTYEGEVTLSGTQWYVHRQAAYDGRTYDIIHYLRKNKTQSTGTLRLDDFWEHYATKNWLVSPDHWVGSVTAAFEAFSGSGSYRTTEFNVQVGTPSTPPPPPPPPVGKPNLVANGGLDAESYDTQTPSGWLEWQHTDASYTESYGGSKSGARHGTHWSRNGYEVATYQKKDLADGLYTLRAWVKGNGALGAGEYAGMYVKNYGGAQRWVDVPRTDTYTLVKIKNIRVTAGGNTEFGFYSKAGAGRWLYFDNVRLTKQ